MSRSFQTAIRSTYRTMPHRELERACAEVAKWSRRQTIARNKLQRAIARLMSLSREHANQLIKEQP